MLRQSSRRTPCPICGRNTDSDCRFSDELILCHCGTRFGPPQGLRVGDVLQVDGRSWALIRTQAGYDGAAHEFRPHSGPPRPRLSRARQRRQQLNIRALMADAMAAADRALAVPEFIHSTPDELQAAWALIDVAVNQTATLQVALKSLDGRSPELREYRALLQEARKLLAYQHRDAINFRTYYLGEVKP